MAAVTVSTHVLDTERGKPAAGVRVERGGEVGRRVEIGRGPAALELGHFAHGFVSVVVGWNYEGRRAALAKCGVQNRQLLKQDARRPAVRHDVMQG